MNKSVLTWRPFIVAMWGMLIAMHQVVDPWYNAGWVAVTWDALFTSIAFTAWVLYALLAHVTLIVRTAEYNFHRDNEATLPVTVPNTQAEDQAKPVGLWDHP